MPVESTRLIENYAFNIISKKLSFTSDVDEKSGGLFIAPDPHDLLEMALAACTAMTVQMYAKRKNIPLDYADVSIKITKEGAENEILREIKFITRPENELTPDQKNSLLAIADKCPIHKFIHTGAKIITEYKEN